MPKLATIATFTGPLEAHIAKGRLETEGVSVFLAHEHHIWAAWYLSHALGGIKIQVREKDQDNAQQILTSHLNGEYEGDLKQIFPTLQSNMCPGCNSTNFTSKLPRKVLLLLILTFGLFGIIFPPRKNAHLCQNCHHK